MKAIRTMLAGLTEADLLEWAGSRIFNRGKGYVLHVSELSRTEDNTLVAWVSGTDEYATSVRYDDDGEFTYSCTCPYGDGPCKHAVAVLLAAGELVRRNVPIPILNPEDELFQEAFLDSDEWMDGPEIDDPASPFFQSRESRVARLQDLLQDKTREELQAVLLELALDYPDVARRLHDAAQIDSGQVDQVVRALRREIRSLASEDAWYDHWTGEGSLPDYSHVETQLQTLLREGHADAVLTLGEELWEQVRIQLETVHDEGETALAIGHCMNVAMRALPQSALSAADQVLWWIARELEDEFCVLSDAAFMRQDDYAAEHWTEVAAELQHWLENIDGGKSGRFHAYNRGTLVDWLLRAYRASGQEREMLLFLEQDADRTGHYELLVKTLQDAGEYAQARQRCIHGFHQTASTGKGSGAGLVGRLRELAAAEKRWDLVTAYLAEDFFVRPMESTYVQLRSAAEKAGCWAVVRQGALRYLETGQRPVSRTGTSDWPLPEPEVRLPDDRSRFFRESFPLRETLLEIALLEKRIADAIAIFQDLPKRDLAHRTVFERLAEAAAAEYPDFALRIWRNTVGWLISQVKARAYEEAFGYLHRMQKVYARTGREAEWTAYLQSLRTEHKAKRRLQEVLNGLDKNRKLVG